jgi:dihydrodipicolinate synthase/N-acetylneuraminate lyase
MMTGAYTLLTTPFNKDMSLEEEDSRTILRNQVRGGIHGLTPLGVIGESPALCEDEVRRSRQSRSSG